MKKINLLLIVFSLISVQIFAQIPESLDWATLSHNGLKELPIDNPNEFTSTLTIENLGGGVITSISIKGDQTYTSGTNFDNFGGNTNKLQLDKIKQYIDGKENLDLDGLEFTLIDNGTPTKKTVNFEIEISDNGTTETEDTPVTLLEIQQKFNEYFDKEYRSEVRSLRNEKNNLILKNNSVQIYIDQFGNTYGAGFPTTAREDYTYTIHFFYYENYSKPNRKFVAEFEGIFDPTFEIYGSSFLGDVRSDPTGAQGDAGEESDKKTPEIRELKFENKGPYTNTFSIRIKEEEYSDDGTNKESEAQIIDQTINIASTHHISLTVGLLGTNLSNPSNFEKRALSASDSTVIADDPFDRGFISLMATFYPKPRNLLYPPAKPIERLGFVVGTRIDKDYNENFLAGLSYDVARGMAITGGVHYGRVNKLQGVNEDFKFGEDSFTGDIQTKKEWELGLFFGVNVDLRVFGVLFNP